MRKMGDFSNGMVPKKFLLAWLQPMFIGKIYGIRDCLRNTL